MAIEQNPNFQKWTQQAYGPTPSLGVAVPRAPVSMQVLDRGVAPIPSTYGKPVSIGEGQSYRAEDRNVTYGGAALKKTKPITLKLSGQGEAIPAAAPVAPAAPAVAIAPTAVPTPTTIPKTITAPNMIPSHQQPSPAVMPTTIDQWANRARLTIPNLPITADTTFNVNPLTQPNYMLPDSSDRSIGVNPQLTQGKSRSFYTNPFAKWIRGL